MWQLSGCISMHIISVIVHVAIHPHAHSLAYMYTNTCAFTHACMHTHVCTQAYTHAKPHKNDSFLKGIWCFHSLDLFASQDIISIPYLKHGNIVLGLTLFC